MRFNGEVSTSDDVVTFDRSALLADVSLQGVDFNAAYTDALDSFIRSYVSSMHMPEGCALLAIGGYGRSQMSPESDLDIVLVHRDGVDIAGFAQQVWYPIWDAGLKLGQRTDSPQSLLSLADADLDTATALLNVRHLIGDEAIGHELALEARRHWRSDPKQNATRLAERVRALHAEHGEVAFSLGPDLKLGRGGLRDIHALGWVAATGVLADNSPMSGLEAPFETLTRVRVGLHRVVGHPGDHLVLDYQDEVAELLGYHDADVLMTDVASAARSVAWVSDASWFWVERSLEQRRRTSDVQIIDTDIRLDGSLLSLDRSTDIGGDPTAALRVLFAAAKHRAFIDHDTLRRLATSTTSLPEPWTTDMRRLFVSLLLLGRSAIGAIEAFDQVGLMTALIPEWEPCRSRPQRNAYHRFTVDRHLLEAAAEASLLAGRVDRPDLLVIGALLHDIGKGYPGDHTEVGVEIIPTIARRMGFSEPDIIMLTAMCEQHLLLPDAATRRDLDDDGTIRSVAETVGSAELLELLYALTISDSIATGPSAWNASKADLVDTLAARVRHVLDGGQPAEVIDDRFPTPLQREMIKTGAFGVEISDTTITVVQRDRDGAFSRAAGVLTLNGLDIVAATVHTDSGMALAEFGIRKSAEIDVKRLTAQLHAGTENRLALDARVDARRKTYRRKRRSAQRIVRQVSFDNSTSDAATVIEVIGRDDVGLLYRVSRALADLGVAISSGRVQTIGDTVVDTFYITSSSGKITDTAHLAEIERAVLHVIGKQ